MWQQAFKNKWCLFRLNCETFFISPCKKTKNKACEEGVTSREIFCMQAINILLSEILLFSPAAVKLVHHNRVYAFRRVYPGANAINIKFNK